MIQYDFAMIGGGMAGASLAAELSPHARVLLAEAEPVPGYHATGRSAAFWEACYGGPGVAPLTLASHGYLADGGFLRTRGALYIGRVEDEPAIGDFAARFADSGVELRRIGHGELANRIPGILPGWTDAISEPDCADIDVAGLHQHYLAVARRNGADVRTGARLTDARRESGSWALTFADGSKARAAVLVNAAGAWADEVAALAGVPELGIAPLRRTMVQVRTDVPPPDDLPLVLDINGGFYFKPENGRLWLSPHDEGESDPCDAAADELDVAQAISRLESVVDWGVQAVERKWAGLRSFAPDRLPVYGFDRAFPDFFWFAGQGGFGIQTAPAAARLAAQILLGNEADEMTRGLDASMYQASRFAG